MASAQVSLDYLPTGTAGRCAKRRPMRIHASCAALRCDHELNGRVTQRAQYTHDS